MSRIPTEDTRRSAASSGLADDTRARRTALAALAVVLLMELPVRLVLQPDPWLLPPGHWYFLQPERLGIELVLAGLLGLILWRLYPDVLRVVRQHVGLMLGAMAVSLVLFASLELEQLQSSLEQPLSNWLVWLMTGLLIGVGQELVYRGLLYGALTSFLRSHVAGAVTTLAFVAAPLHSLRLWEYALQGEWVVVMMLVAIYCSASSVFQWLRDRTASVVVPALVHGVGNAITWMAVIA